jgi:CRP/FNR family transcriptional regulator, cyclic AMP receptor protein
VDSPVSCRVIQCLSDPERARLLDRGVTRSLQPGEILHLAGDRERRVHVVSDGVIKMTARDAQGAETILCLAVPGDVVGDIAALDELPQPLDAVAASPCTVVGVDADLFVEVISSSRAAVLELGRALAGRTRWVCDTALERTSSEVPARLAGRLLDLADLIGFVRHGAIEMELPLAQRDLGRLAGMCRESACKTMRRFKMQGMVDYDGRRVRILEPAALEKVRSGGRAAGSSR